MRIQHPDSAAEILRGSGEKVLSTPKFPLFSHCDANFGAGDRFAMTASSATQSGFSGIVQSPGESPGIPGLWRAKCAAETRSREFLANSACQAGLSLRSPFSNVRILDAACRLRIHGQPSRTLTARAQHPLRARQPEVRWSRIGRSRSFSLARRSRARIVEEFRTQ